MRTAVRRTGLTFVAAGGVLNGISCSGDDVTGPTTGSLEITTATSGPDPDGDGYGVTIDGGVPTALGVNATLQRHDLDAGNHSVQLSGLASNCTLTGDNPRNISVTSAETARVTFQVTCTAATGILQISVATSGPSPDPDGYSVTLNGTDRGVLITGTILTVDHLPAGDHVVGLSDVATNCQVQGDNPRTVTLRAGQTATVTFSITCTAPQSKIAFVSGRDGNAEIYVMNGDGTGLTRLTNNPGYDSEPDWSPDGARIVFRREAGVYIMNADGSGQTKLTNLEPAFSPTWSPDGTKIAFVTSVDVSEWSSYNQIMIMNADGTGARVASGLGRYADLDWSPDGTRIAFSGWYEYDDFIHSPDFIGIIKADGSGEDPISSGENACESDPAWSNDGRIAYASAPVDPDDDTGDDCSEDTEIQVVNSDGSGVTRLTNNVESDYFPAWSNDDRKIAFVRYEDGNSDIYLMNADGSGQTWLTNGSEPSWAP